MFAFSQIDPRTTGQVSEMEVPFSRYLGAAWDEGDYNSAFSTLSRMTETNLNAGGKVLQPDEANKRFALADLKFDSPVDINTAELLHQRKQMQLDRNFLMTQDNHSIAAGIAGMGTQMVAGMANPLDFSLMFMPFVGEGKIAESASVMGRGAMLRQALQRGIVTSKTLSELTPFTAKFPKFSASVFNGVVSQAALDIPRGIAASTNHEKFDAMDALKDVAAGGAFAGLFHIGMAGAAKLFGNLTDETKGALFRKAMDDYAKGDDISVQDYVKLDEAYIQTRAKFDEFKARAEAEEAFPGGDKIVSSAIKLEDGTVLTGSSHYSIADNNKGISLDAMGDSENPNIVSGFVTESGKFLNRAEAEKHTGFGYGEDVGMHTSQIPYAEQARQKSIQDFIDNARKNHDVVGRSSEIRKQDIEKQLAEGKILTDEQIAIYYQHDGALSEKDTAVLDKDISNLKESMKASENLRKSKENLNQAKKNLKNLEDMKKWMENDSMKEAEKYNENGLTEAEQKIIDSVPKSQSDAIEQALGCITKKML